MRYGPCLKTVGIMRQLYFKSILSSLQINLSRVLINHAVAVEGWHERFNRAAHHLNPAARDAFRIALVVGGRDLFFERAVERLCVRFVNVRYLFTRNSVADGKAVRAVV